MRVRWQALWKNLLPCEASKHYVTSVPTYVGKKLKTEGGWGKRHASPENGEEACATPLRVDHATGDRLRPLFFPEGSSERDTYLAEDTSREKERKPFEGSL